ncbi:MAG TPA: VCBS repeat-containing protein, partial [Pirellulales bacterium]|nr:VCBS repeat-containing protein [Pirellulales bacterium]
MNRTSASAAAHNYERTYAVSMSLLAGRGYRDLAIDDSPGAAPLRDFFGMRSLRISREQFAAYLREAHDPASDPWFGRYMPLASTRIADVWVATILWRIFGIDRQVLTTFYALFSVATCGALFLIARRLSGSGWAGLAAAALLTISPIEGFLTTWSVRDTSPMWFTAASMAWFVCAMQRSRRPAINGAACLVLGGLTVLGIGWRIDALMLAPFLGGCMVVRLIADRVGWRCFLISAACFALGAIGIHAGIEALGPPQAQTSSIGYHMAVYSDFRRSKILGVENSRQVMFDDMQTLDDARQIYRAENPGAEPLAYLTPEYCKICRRMFFEQLSYNLYHWIASFPKFYSQALAGLDRDSVIGQPGSKRIQTGLRSPLRQAFRWGDKLGHAMPYLFLIGAFATILAGRQRLVAALVALFSVYFVGIMFLVLPDQKHIAALLVPLYIFAGAGIWAVCRLFVRSTWHDLRLAELKARVFRACAAVFVVAAIWGLGCVWAHAHSVERREELLSEIRGRATMGTDSPEMLRGERNFAAPLRSDGTAEAAGYLLTISAAAHPGALTCRQIYFPHDWAHVWGRELITFHTLIPNREQSFFVSCLACTKLGDPRPQLCSVAIDGDAKILRCTRVDLKDWSHTQVSTLFYDGQRSPGSPAEMQSPADWLVIDARPFADCSPDKQENDRDGMTDRSLAVAKVRSGGRPLRQMIARSADTGAWKIAMSDGWRFSFVEMNYWSPTKNWLQLETGDFNGDGMTDFVGQAPDGQWWIALANGKYNPFHEVDSLPTNVRYDFVGVGDFNGDGLDDLILRSSDGHWTLALSTGDGFRCRPIDSLPAAAKQNSLIGDTRGLAHLPMPGEENVPVPFATAMPGEESAPVPFATVAKENLLIGDFLGNGRKQL